MCVCVCVCERERERERDRKIVAKEKCVSDRSPAKNHAFCSSLLWYDLDIHLKVSISLVI